MKLENIECLFFDLGSTLIDETPSEKIRIELLHTVLQERGISASVEKIREIIDDASKDYAPSSFREAVKRFCRDKAECESVWSLTRYSHDHEILYPDTIEVLERLYGHYKIGFIANQNAGTEKRLENSASGIFSAYVFHRPNSGWKNPTCDFPACARKSGLRSGTRRHDRGSPGYRYFSR